MVGWKKQNELRLVLVIIFLSVVASEVCRETRPKESLQDETDRWLGVLIRSVAYHHLQSITPLVFPNIWNYAVERHFLNDDCNSNYAFSNISQIFNFEKIEFYGLHTARITDDYPSKIFLFEPSDKFDFNVTIAFDNLFMKAEATIVHPPKGIRSKFSNVIPINLAMLKWKVRFEGEIYQNAKFNFTNITILADHLHESCNFSDLSAFLKLFEISVPNVNN